MKNRYWQNLTTSDFAGLDAEATVALLPVAAVEQHGPHLPLATDALINRAIVEETLKRASADLEVLVLPALNVGSSLEHESFAGTLSLEPETVLALWRQIGGSVARAGVRKLVILNTHGGQTGLVDIAALELRARHGMLVARGNLTAFGVPPGLFPDEALPGDIHGGLIETSLMLYLHPELVRSEAVEDFTGLPDEMGRRNQWLGAEKPVGLGWLSEDLHGSGACGNAAAADAASGAAFLDHVATALARLLSEVAGTRLTAAIHGGAKTR